MSPVPMTRPYALRRLLEHGPLTFAEAWAITGWQKPELAQAIDELIDDKVIKTMVDNFRFNTRYVLRNEVQHGAN